MSRTWAISLAGQFGLLPETVLYLGMVKLHYSTGVSGTVEVESAWLAHARDLALANTHISEARCGAPTFAGMR